MQAPDTMYRALGAIDQSSLRSLCEEMAMVL